MSTNGKHKNGTGNGKYHAPKIVPVILSGGMGTRLWPMSRGNYPKQFLNLGSPDMSLIQETLLRVRDPEIFESPVIVCNQEHRFLVAEKTTNTGFTATVILEPCARNTAPALGVAAHYLKEKYKDALMLVLPSDHIIRDTKAFLAGVEAAAEIAAKGRLVTSGIKPEYAETGYGYIKYDKPINKKTESYDLSAFIEKPDQKTAEKYVESKEYAWNSGMFMFPVSGLLAELKEFQPDIFKVTETASKERIEDQEVIRLDKRIFEAAQSLSIDYAVMEHTKKAAVVALECGWSDAGSWDALWRISAKDKDGNVSIGTSYKLDTENCYVSCEDGPTVATLGVDNLVVISTKDCILVARKDRAQDIKHLVNYVKKQEVQLVENHRQVYRPWGYYDSINNGKRHQVKRIHVKPGAKLSLQMHYHRAEHWIVVKGTALVECDGKRSLLSENQSIYIPYGVVHRIENPGKIELEIIEVQSGSYLGEDDIVRFEDAYGRNQKEVKTDNQGDPLYMQQKAGQA